MAGSVYSDESDLNLDDQRIIELTDSAAEQGIKDQNVLDQASLRAQSIIDGTLQARYTVPFVAGDVPDLIRGIHADIWRFLLFKRRDALTVPADVRDDYKEARDTLDKIMDRTILLVTDVDTQADVNAAPKVASNCRRGWMCWGAD